MRFSRGRSTPTRRAMSVAFLEGRLPFGQSRWSGRVASLAYGVGSGHPLRRLFTAREPLSDHVDGLFSCTGRGSALALLVARVLADHHDAAVATNHLALVTDRLHARVDLHGQPFVVCGLFTCTGRRCDPE